MKRLQAFKFQLRPNGQQEREMRRFAGACRFVFNRALARQNENYEAGNKYIPYTKMASWLIEWKSDTETQWLKEAPSQPLQQSLKDLERAYKNFFQKRTAFPRFKKRGKNDAFRYPQGVKLDQSNSRISLPKLGWMRYRNSREVVGEVRNVTVSQSCGKWYVSIQTEYEATEPQPESTSIVGLDAGVTKLATLSDGTVYPPVSSFKVNQRKLARLQRKLSRKIKFSANWQWYEMRRQLEYKQLWRGGQVLAIPPAYTSQKCACCGHTAKENRQSQSQFECLECGYTANADINGARNILAAGHAVLACGGRGQSDRPSKQEPAEVIQTSV
ncbi:transposase [Proteus mirabilis]|uniref:RNA-guided endonuclease InsQ/TnpB family protein n=1 Tax=Proteus mirabilis TaxID=584 RepID=UPI00234BEA1C|nr:transposase [Proteus mirabilis]MDC5973634.1 transposase [Proteus mirabilis]